MATATNPTHTEVPYSSPPPAHTNNPQNEQIMRITKPVLLVIAALGLWHVGIPVIKWVLAVIGVGAVGYVVVKACDALFKTRLEQDYVRPMANDFSKFILGYNLF